MTLAIDVKGYSQLNKSINSATGKDKNRRAKRVSSCFNVGIKTPEIIRRRRLCAVSLLFLHAGLDFFGFRPLRSAKNQPKRANLTQ